MRMRKVSALAASLPPPACLLTLTFLAIGFRVLAFSFDAFLEAKRYPLRSKTLHVRRRRSKPRQTEQATLREFSGGSSFHQPRGVAGHGVDFKVDVAALRKGAERRHLQRVGNDQHRERVTLHRIDGQRNAVER